MRGPVCLGARASHPQAAIHRPRSTVTHAPAGVESNLGSTERNLLGVARGTHKPPARRANQASARGRANSETDLSKAVKHHWYGETSPWTEQQLEDYYGHKSPQPRPSDSKGVISDRENPPQWRSDRDVED